MRDTSSRREFMKSAASAALMSYLATSDAVAPAAPSGPSVGEPPRSRLELFDYGGVRL